MTFSTRDIKEFRLDGDNVICTTNFVKPVHIVMMSAIHNYTDKLATFSNILASEYANNMRWQTPLGIETIDGRNHSKAIKLKNQFDDDAQVNKVISIFTNNGYLDAETNDVLKIILSEIFQNFYAHADFEEPPICCVQDWPTSDYIEISIADRGIGIHNSLSEVLETYPKNTNPCRIACDSGVSCSLNRESAIGTRHSGYGLYFTKRFIEQNQGGFYLYSGDKCYINIPQGEFDKTLNLHWNGTVVRLVINKAHCVISEQFFQTVAREQEGEAYDEFF